jgi:hypothetical protein
MKCAFTHPSETQVLEVGKQSIGVGLVVDSLMVLVFAFPDLMFRLRKCIRVHRADADWIWFKRHLVVGFEESSNQPLME